MRREEDEETLGLLTEDIITGSSNNYLRSRFRGGDKKKYYNKEREGHDFEDKLEHLENVEPAVVGDANFFNKYVACKNTEKIVAVFVVAFDAKAGNVLEWAIPDDVDMEGVEFKALTSGSHNMITDFVYFKKGNLFGLSCFERSEVESEMERKTRMKSVGVLTTTHTCLHQYMTFLQQEVSFQLKFPKNYDGLIEFWNKNKALLDINDTSGGDSPYSERLLDFKINHPIHNFSHFFKFFGPQIFVLWKMSLLGKRILFYSPPPIGVVCYRVFCTSQLSKHSRHRCLQTCPSSEPYFYINVADIDDIQSETSYIACTTEKIFETKPHLYDVYVDNRNILSSNPSLKDILKVNDVDRDKYNNLTKCGLNKAFACEDEEEEDEDEMLMDFFREQNNKIFDILLEVSCSDDRRLTRDHVTSMNLHPQHDQSFLAEIAETFSIDVLFVIDNPCCPT